MFTCFVGYMMHTYGVCDLTEYIDRKERYVQKPKTKSCISCNTQVYMQKSVVGNIQIDITFVPLYRIPYGWKQKVKWGNQTERPVLASCLPCMHASFQLKLAKVQSNGYTLHRRRARMYYPYNWMYVHNRIGLLTYIITTMMSGLDYVKSQTFSYSLLYTRIAYWIRDVRKSSPICLHVCFTTTTMMMAKNQKKSNNKNVSFFTSSSLVDSSSSWLNLQFM